MGILIMYGNFETEACSLSEDSHMSTLSIGWMIPTGWRSSGLTMLIVAKIISWFGPRIVDFGLVKITVLEASRTLLSAA